MEYIMIEALTDLGSFDERRRHVRNGADLQTDAIIIIYK